MNRAPLTLLLSLFTVPASGGEPGSGEFRGNGLTVELVSEVSAVRPGQPFHAGLFIKHDPGSHTYWKNPGLAGVATNLEWSLPDGWTAGEIEWPAPDKVKMANIDTHGYGRDVLLMVKLTPPAKIENAVTLRAKASWMCCGRLCNPGFCNLTLTLPVVAGEKPAWHPRWHKVFENERASMPVPLTGWKLSAVRKGKAVVLTGTPERKDARVPENPQFFSSDNLICSHPPQVWRRTDAGFEVELTVSDFPPKDQSALRGLLRGKGGWLTGDSRAATIEVPLK